MCIGMFTFACIISTRVILVSMRVILVSMHAILVSMRVSMSFIGVRYGGRAVAKALVTVVRIMSCNAAGMWFSKASSKDWATLKEVVNELEGMAEADNGA
jgi:hypothetical protein